MAKKIRKKSEESTPINVTEAVRRAADFLTQIFADTNVKDIRLEEVEFLDDENCWLITLSFLRPIAREEFPRWQRLTEISGGEYRREYKSVEMDAQNGKPRSIKIRSLSDGV